MVQPPLPQVYHTSLNTTFRGVVHSVSTPEAPICQFRGIKYASVSARFRHSKLFSAYGRVTDASSYGPICPQPDDGTVEEALIGMLQYDRPKQTRRHDEFECLNLNITCPSGLTSASRLPVMLWVHGGGDRGSGSSWIYDGGPLVRKSMQMGKPVILVTFNFRIGLFGFAASAALREDNKLAGEQGVGNYGLRDQRRAMEWVNLFISGFGGDPSNVTIFGGSTGAADVLCHLLSAANLSYPMFHRAIVQSAIIDHHVPDIQRAGWHLSRVMSTLHVSTLDQLRAVDCERLAALQYPLRVTDDGVFFRPGWKESIAPRTSSLRPLLPGQSHLNTPARSSICTTKSRKSSLSPMRTTRSPSPARRPALAGLQPLIIGDCANESIIWSGAASRWTMNGVTRRLKAVCQSLAKASTLIRGYYLSNAPPGEVVDRVLELINDARVAWPTDCVAEAAKRDRGGRNVWRYAFDQEGPTRGVPHHAADLLYLFDNVPYALFAPHTALADPQCYSDPLELLQDIEELKLKLEAAGDTRGYMCTEPDYVDGSDPAEVGCCADDWSMPLVDEWSFRRVRDAIQEKWIAFANGEAPWNEDKIFVFGPEGETGERSKSVLEGRRRRDTWRETLEPLGMQLVQKVGVELCNGPPFNM